MSAKIKFRDPVLSALFFFALSFWSCEDHHLDKLFLKADEQWTKGRNQTAIEILKSILEEVPSGALTEKVIFRLGEINYFSLSNSSKALYYFQELLRLNPKNLTSYKAQKYIAEIVEFDLKNLDQAILENQKLIDEFDYPEDRGNYQFRIAAIYFKKQDFEQALIELEILLENYPESPWAEKAAFRITNILYTSNRCEEARKRYEWFVKHYSESKYISEMIFVMASCLEEEGELNLAYEKFKSLEKIYPYPSLLKMKLTGIEERVRKKRGKKKKSPFVLKRETKAEKI